MTNNNPYHLYQITNLINGKFYIGVHRCASNCARYASCPYMGSGWIIKRAIKKYGPANFRKDILAEVETEKFAYDLEAAVIDHAFVDRADTYNLIVGGGIPPIPQKGRTHAKHTEETKQKMRVAGLGRTHTEEAKSKVSKAKLGKKRLPFSIEWKNNMSAAHIGLKHTPEQLTKMSVMMMGKNRGKTRSLEVKQKMSATKKGKPWSLARRAAQTMRDHGPTI